jgi:molybdate transport system substrate-binding protein
MVIPSSNVTFSENPALAVRPLRVPLYIGVYCVFVHKELETPVPMSFTNKAAAAAIALAASFAQAGDLHVSAAASLTNAFTDIAAGYEASHAGTKVLLNFGASGALLQQMAKGAPADVFASADQETMDLAAKQGLIAGGERRNFARNSLVLIVPRDSRQALRRLQDLGQPAVRQVAIGNPASVPVGRYTRHALASAKLWPAIAAKAINTQSVRQSLDYVARGEVDAGFVYGTDAALMKDKVKVAFEVPLDVAIGYPIARTSTGTSAGAGAAEARRFIEYVLSPAGQAVLAKYGFQKP